MVPKLMEYEAGRREMLRASIQKTKENKEKVLEKTLEVETMSKRMKEEVVRVQEASMMTRHVLTARQEENSTLRKSVQERYEEVKRMRGKVLHARERLVHLQNEATLNMKDKGPLGDSAVHEIAAMCEELHSKLRSIRENFAGEDDEEEWDEEG
jgi:hypothetical protein